jgi:hypothetical protein
MNTTADTQMLKWPYSFGGLLGGAGETGWFFDVGIGRKAILWMIACYLILNQGFMLVRVPPIGSGIPIGELVLVLSLLTLNLTVVIPRMSGQVWMFPILLWWAYSLSRAVLDIGFGGVWALRDSSQEIESLFLIVGFWLVNRPIYLRYFFRWLRRTLVVLGFYALLFPMSATLEKFSPSLSAMNTSVRSLFFQMNGIPSLALWVVAWLLMERPGERKPQIRMRYLAATFLLVWTAAFAQERTVYNQIAFLILLFMVFRRKVAARWIMILILGALLIGIVTVSGITLKGRVGKKISLDFIMHHIESASGQGEAGEGTSALASNAVLRFTWWKHIAVEMESSRRKMFFGLGFGMPLTNYPLGPGIVLREPHDSYISVWARLGVFGLLLWVLMQAMLFQSWWKSYRLTRRLNWVQDQQNLLLLLIYWILIMVYAIGEPAFELPFLAIPYYLFAGVMLRYGIFLREAATASLAELELTMLR